MTDDDRMRFWHIAIGRLTKLQREVDVCRYNLGIAPYDLRASSKLYESVVRLDEFRSTIRYLRDYLHI